MSAIPDTTIDPTEARAFGDIVALTREMLARAQSGDWETTLGLEQQRQRMLTLFFAAPVPPGDAPGVAAGIREILDIDRELMELGKQGMDELAAKLEELSSGRRAVKAYGTNR